MSTTRVNMKRTLMLVFGLLIAATGLVSRAEAGVALGATRVIYPAGQNQVPLAATKHAASDTYLIQSWVETPTVTQDGPFLVMPPLFALPRKTDNTLRTRVASKHHMPPHPQGPHWTNF